MLFGSLGQLAYLSSYLPSIPRDYQEAIGQERHFAERVRTPLISRAAFCVG